jgi:hypothetical protein
MAEMAEMAGQWTGCDPRARATPRRSAGGHLNHPLMGILAR